MPPALRLALPLLVISCQEYHIGPAAPPDQTTTLPEKTQEGTRSPQEGVGPVALCEVIPAELLLFQETAHWIGNSSYAADGGPLTYEWSLVDAPTGSNTEFPPGSQHSPNRLEFSPDLAGTYTARLIVTDEFGQASDPCFVDLKAIPANELWVEMFWEHASDDMDLHLVRDDGSPFSSQDCFFDNCIGGLSWGPAGPAGNPALDLDDIPGTGPENINVERPEDLTYRVFVHDYTLAYTHFTPANDVTVRIHIDGELVWEDTRSISGEDTFEHFADIHWATGEVEMR
ncbi:MAG: PKD domain-containing protein [Myxococcales bacterium]|nr:PKD domain-containing protein [Myxococcales bacterium]